MFIKCDHELHTNIFSSVLLPFSCSDKLKRSHVSTTIMSLKQHIDNCYMRERERDLTFKFNSTNSTRNIFTLLKIKNSISECLVNKEIKCFGIQVKPQSIYKGGQKVLGLES